MIQIFGATVSSYVWVVRMVCEEKRVPYELVPAGLHSEEIYAIHPFGKTPPYCDMAISDRASRKPSQRYIDSAISGPQLIPEDARRWRKSNNGYRSSSTTAIDPCMISAPMS